LPSRASARMLFEARVAVYLRSLYNLDLLSQGWYAVRVRVRREEGGRKAVVLPRRQVTGAAPRGGTLDETGDELPPEFQPSVNEETYLSRLCFIRYMREEVIMEEIAEFRVPLSAGEAWDATSDAVILQFELLFAKPTVKDAAAAWRALKPVASQELRAVSPVRRGAHEAFELTFDELHLGLLKGMAHCVVLRVDDDTTGNASVVSGGGGGDDAAGTSGRELEQQQSEVEEALPLGVVSKALRGAELTRERLSALLTRGCPLGVSSSRYHGGRQRGGGLTLEPLGGRDETGKVGGGGGGGADEGVALVHKEASSLWRALVGLPAVSLKLLWGALAADREEARERSSAIFVRQHDPPPVAKAGNLLEQALDLPTVEADAAKRARKVAGIRKELEGLMRDAGGGAPAIQDARLFGSPAAAPVVLTTAFDVNQVAAAAAADLSDIEISPKSARGLPAERFFAGLAPAPARDRKDEESVLSAPQIPAVVVSPPPSSAKAAGPHVCVFVHGFQGYFTDLRLVRAHLLRLDPEMVCLSSVTNQSDTYNDLQVMGERLAVEVVEFLGNHPEPARLSFVGHSIGNLIVRAALLHPVLQPFVPRLHTFLSISGPHLGYLSSRNMVFDAGIRLLKTFKRSPCLHQLCLTDADRAEDCFLYRLAQHGCLGKFRNVVLLSCPQDGYVPPHSARVEACPKLSTCGKNGPNADALLRNLLEPVMRRHARGDAGVFMRVEVDFPMPKCATNINQAIGREAHIQLIQTDVYVQHLLSTLPRTIWIP